MFLKGGVFFSTVDFTVRTKSSGEACTRRMVMRVCAFERLLSLESFDNSSYGSATSRNFSVGA